jgi:hypothetical protein
MCNCKNIEIGSYDNQVTLETPEWMTKRTVDIDACLVDEIKDLWACGIHTTGCCCGHNKVSPMINIEDNYGSAMISLGYDWFLNEFDIFCFIPKTTYHK